MRSASGFVLFTAGLLATLGVIVWSLVLAVPLARELAGMAGAVAAVVLFPLTLVLAPWYAGLARGAWTLLAVAYGGGIVALALLGAGITALVQHLNMNTSPGNPRRKFLFFGG
jgi:hypothetical protein